MQTSQDAEDQELLQLVIDELRRLFDNVNDSFNHLRTKALALLGGEIAIITFLFASDPTNHYVLTSMSNLVFFLAGIITMASSFVILVSVLSTAAWGHPPDTALTRKLKERVGDTPLKFLIYLKSEYEDMIEHHIAMINVRSRRFMWAIYAFILASFILIMLKYGVGGIGI